MENYGDKENVRAKKTRIPLPLPPLPALPSHLLNKLNRRQPLNTIAGPNGKQDNAGPSNSRCQSLANTPNTPFRRDTKYVTVRRGCDSSYYDVAYQDGKGRLSEQSIISISSDDDNTDTKEKQTYFTDDGFLNKRIKSASTPALHTLQPAPVKNITRSLKRPHSGELLGATPLENRERGDDRVKRRLNFDQSPDQLQKSYMTGMDREYTADILSYLLQVERKLDSLPRVKNDTRACVINWLMKINGVNGNPGTIQAAVWYLDAVLASSNVTLENMQLIAAASYWIAAKIHGPRMTRIPASRLVKYANDAFTVERLLVAEKAILERLKFPQQPVTPQDFLCHFAWCCTRERPDEIEVATTFLCLCGMMVNKKLCRKYPSVVAAAALRNALLLLRKKELIPRLQTCPAYLAAEKKVKDLSQTCAIIRKAVLAVAAKDYSYKFVLKKYGTPPKCIAQSIVSAAYELAVLDTKSSADVIY